MCDVRFVQHKELYLNTLKEREQILTFARVSPVSDCAFTMAVCEKIYMESYINEEYIFSQK